MSVTTTPRAPLIPPNEPPERPKPALRRRRRARWRGHPRWLPIGLALVLVLIAGGGLAAIGAWHARTIQEQVTAEVKAGAADLDVAKTDARRASGAGAKDDLAAADHRFASAQRHFEQAKRIAARDSIVQAAASSPGPVGSYTAPRIRALNAVSDLGIALAATGRDAIPFQAALQGVGEDTSKSAGERFVAVMKRSGPVIDRLTADLTIAERAAARIDLRLLPSSQRASFASARSSIDSAYAGIKELKAATPALLEILGANGPRTYLIEQMNPAELRAGGGFIGSYALLLVDGGKFSMVKSGGIADIDYPRPDTLGHCIDARYMPTACQGHQYVAPPSVMLDFLGGKSWVLGDSNFAPHFADAAKVAETFAAKELHAAPDGVIAIDPQFVASLLSFTGPIKLPDFNFTADGNTFVNELFNYENSRQASAATVRKALFPALAAPLLERLTSLPETSWSNLLSALNASAARHDLQVYFNNPDAEALMQRYGWSNDLQTSAASDFMYENESNFGGTKANFFVKRSFDVQLAAEGGTLHHTVAVTLTNSMPDGKYEGKNFYRTYLRFYAPQNASNLRIRDVFGDSHPSDEHPAQLKMVDGWQQINVMPARGSGSATVTFMYDTPFDSHQPHRIYWQKQPGTGSDQVTITFTSDGKTFKAAGDLAQDRIVQLTVAGVSLAAGQGGAAKLPGLSV